MHKSSAQHYQKKSLYLDFSLNILPRYWITNLWLEQSLVEQLGDR